MIDPIPYVPRYLSHLPTPLPNPGSAWRGLELILPSLIEDFALPVYSALEFGVEGGFSTAALATYFLNVTAVDFFIGDEHSGVKSDPAQLERETRAALAQWPNIEVVTANCFVWMERPENQASDYSLCHADIVHNYEPTLRALLWASDHAELVIAHDTESFPEVRRACADAAEAKGRFFYNYPECHGLGILSRREPLA